MSAPGPAAPGEVPVCSSKGCRADAVWAVRWNNPRLHAPQRRKVWLACEAHREHLAGFVAARGFLIDVVRFADLRDAEGQAGAGSSP